MQLVSSFASSKGRFEIYQALVSLGDAALPALRNGLKDENWIIRHWSAICLDRLADANALQDLIPLLHDPVDKVRLWAVHAIACDHCKDGVTCPVDVVPHLIERIETDDSVRVRRMAVIMLTTDFQDPRSVPVLQQVLRKEKDAKLLLHTREGLERLRIAGVHIVGDRKQIS